MGGRWLCCCCCLLARLLLVALDIRYKVTIHIIINTPLLRLTCSPHSPHSPRSPRSPPRRSSPPASFSLLVVPAQELSNQACTYISQYIIILVIPCISTLTREDKEEEEEEEEEEEGISENGGGVLKEEVEEEEECKGKRWEKQK